MSQLLIKVFKILASVINLLHTLLMYQILKSRGLFSIDIVLQLSLILQYLLKEMFIILKKKKSYLIIYATNQIQFKQKKQKKFQNKHLHRMSPLDFYHILLTIYKKFKFLMKVQGRFKKQEEICMTEEILWFRNQWTQLIKYWN